jgi:hypothetical protein
VFVFCSEGFAIIQLSFMCVLGARFVGECNLAFNYLRVTGSPVSSEKH